MPYRKEEPTMTDRPTLDELLQDLARCRHSVETQKAYIEAIQEEIDAAFGARLTVARERLLRAQVKLTDCDQVVRDRAVQTFQQTGDKKPSAAVQIKEYTVLVYDEDVALEFCRTSMPDVLKLDKRLFEKVARTLKELPVAKPDLDFVTVTVEPRASIASDLSAWLPQKGEDDAD